MSSLSTQPFQKETGRAQKLSQAGEGLQLGRGVPGEKEEVHLTASLSRLND